jgi:hypothetical protein
MSTGASSRSPMLSRKPTFGGIEGKAIIIPETPAVRSQLRSSAAKLHDTWAEG